MDFGMVGYLKDRDRLDLIRLYLVAVALDADGIVDQLIRMGAAGAEVDRTGLARDIGRLLNKYYALPLNDIRAREVVEEIMPIAFQHHLHLPSDLWLLGKTLAMMEGVGLQLDPEFDVFAVAQPFVRRLLWNMAIPNARWVRAALLGGANWGEMLNRIPRAGNRMLERIERDEPFRIQIDDTDQIISRLDRLFTLLSLSILVGALIIGLTFLVSNPSQSDWGQWMIIGGLVLIISLGIWLFILLFAPKLNDLFSGEVLINDKTSAIISPKSSKKDKEANFLSMKIRFLGHSCIEIIGYRHIVIDPDFTTEPESGVEYICVTHGHQDHIGRLAEISTGVVIASPDVCQMAMQMGVSHHRMRPVQPGEQIANIRVLPGYSQTRGFFYRFLYFLLYRRKPEPATTPLSFLILDEASFVAYW